MNDRPLGPVVDATPAARPDDVRLTGRFCTIEKLDPARHAGALWGALKSDNAIWDYMGYGPFGDETSFVRWLEERAVLLDPYSYAVIDNATREATGIVTLMEIRPSGRVIEIGNIVYSPLLQRTPAATEVQYLAARYVFDDLQYRRYEWKCNALNEPSKRSALRLGFTYEGKFRQHMIVKGRNRDTAWYAMMDSEWPAIAAAFERWLDPANFDATGKQKTGLAGFRTGKAKWID